MESKEVKTERETDIYGGLPKILSQLIERYKEPLQYGYLFRQDIGDYEFMQIIIKEYEEALKKAQ